MINKPQFLPTNFGPILWNVIHVAAAAYPINPTYNEITEMKYFITGIPACIPCEKCKKDTRDFIQSNVFNTTFDNRENLFRFTVVLHNHVNRKLGKMEMDIEQAKNKWGLL